MSSPQSVSPPMLGEIKTRTPIEVTIDNSLLDSAPTADIVGVTSGDNIVEDVSDNTLQQMEIDPASEEEQQEEQQEEEQEEDDPIDKMRALEILPDLYNLIHDVIQGKIQPKDFHNNAGSLRLKLNTLKQYMQEVEGVGETLQTTQAKIDSLRVNNERKRSVLQMFKKSVESRLEHTMGDL